MGTVGTLSLDRPAPDWGPKNRILVRTAGVAGHVASSGYVSRNERNPKEFASPEKETVIQVSSVRTISASHRRVYWL